MADPRWRYPIHPTLDAEIRDALNSLALFVKELRALSTEPDKEKPPPEDRSDGG